MRCVQKVKKFSLIPVILAGLFYFLHIPLPTSHSPYRLYSTEQGIDLKEVLKKAIRSSQKSIILHSYAMTDPGILSLLKAKGEAGVKVDLYYHQKTDPFLHHFKGKNLTFHPIQERGLMHEKIWIIDETLLFLGSANLTSSSLKMHENLMVGLYSPPLAKILAEERPGKVEMKVGNKKLLYFSLPHPEAFDTLLKTLEKGKKFIDVSLFTFTHPTLVEKLIETKKRGVAVHVSLDGTTAQGASCKAKERLEEGGGASQNKARKSALPSQTCSH